MDDTTVSWLAALIDGEGSVMLTARNKQKNWRPVVSIYNTDFRLIEALVERTGGGGAVYSHVRGPKENNKLLAYSWRMRVYEIREFLPLCLPWLVCKQEQAVLLLRALELKASLTITKGVSLSYTRDERETTRAKIAEIAAEISRLNRKGRLVTNQVIPLP